MKKWLGFGISVCAVMAMTAPVVAQDEKPEKKKPEPPADKKPAAGEEGMPPMSPEAMAQWAAWMELGMVGPHHEKLKPMVGSWQVAGKFRGSEKDPWMESTSTGRSEWILGGRFLHQHFLGDTPMMPGQPPFEGFGVIGYDNQKQKYTSAWIDNMSTMIMTAEGACDASGKTFTFSGKFTDPVTDKEGTMKSIYKIDGDDKFTLTFTGPDPATGKEFISGELVFTRKQGAATRPEK